MKKEKDFFEKYCPSCGSTDLELYMGGTLGFQYKCKKCNWIGLPFEKKIIK